MFNVAFQTVKHFPPFFSIDFFPKSAACQKHSHIFGHWNILGNKLGYEFLWFHGCNKKCCRKWQRYVGNRLQRVVGISLNFSLSNEKDCLIEKLYISKYFNRIFLTQALFQQFTDVVLRERNPQRFWKVFTKYSPTTRMIYGLFTHHFSEAAVSA